MLSLMFSAATVAPGSSLELIMPFVIFGLAITGLVMFGLGIHRVRRR